MLRSELLELLTHDEGSQLEFKDDRVAPEELARELVALANHEGGHILLGVDDEGVVIGLTRRDVEEWVFNVARDKVRPPLNPGFDLVHDVDGDRDVAVVTVDRGVTVHQRWHNNRGQYYIRAGSECREASPEELQRLFQRRGNLRAEIQPVGRATIDDLDHRRLDDYFGRVRAQELAPEGDPERERLLHNLDFLVSGVGGVRPSVAGMVLFGREPGRFLRHAQLDLIAFGSEEVDYDIIDREEISGPLVALESDGASEWGAIEHAVNFVSRHLDVSSELLEGVRRQTSVQLPQEPVREAIVNAVAHRDYLLEGSRIQVRVFRNALEIVSPGRPPNGVTLESMRQGDRASRNDLFVDVLRDYGYVDRLGMGIARKMIRVMREFNDTEPQFDLVNETLTVRLDAVTPHG